MNRKFITLIIVMMILIVAVSSNVPSGPTIEYFKNETVDPNPSTFINTSGGSFTTLNLNLTSQNYKWKAYVGNVTGKLTLDDSVNNTIYDWTLSTVSGNVYATRNGSIDWTSLSCADRTTIYGEETYLSIDTSKDDSINSTFTNEVHKSFYASNNFITNSTCPAIATYVNDQAQAQSEDADFQEILLEDSAGTLIYTTVIENNVIGFDTNPYDFQMIVADDETTTTNVPYYFYVELR
ncbi:hypothetical protein C0585_00030 [Candidatus Woesearchaeota archaeon]|nr:MAG: hypothetical protein C0585_00030 [Candidatus Woesearchaeota archaeon]